MKYFFFTILISCFLNSTGQNGPAIINDSDGYTNVRSGPGIQNKVIDTLFISDFFYFTLDDTSDWAKITSWRGKLINGFIHQSRIQEIKNLDNKSLRDIIFKVLTRQRTLADNFRAAWKAKDSLGYLTTRRELENYNDSKYDPILQIIPEYFCSTNDAEIIDAFFGTMWSDKGSANEMPSFSIGACFICNPDLVLERLDKIMDNQQRIFILDHIEWGLMNHFKVDEDGNSVDKKFDKLIDLVNKERKKASP